MRAIRGKSKIPGVVMYTGGQMLLLDVPFMALLVQPLG